MVCCLSLSKLQPQTLTRIYAYCQFMHFMDEACGPPYAPVFGEGWVSSPLVPSVLYLSAWEQVPMLGAADACCFLVAPSRVINLSDREGSGATEWESKDPGEAYLAMLIQGVSTMLSPPQIPDKIKRAPTRCP